MVENIGWLREEANQGAGGPGMYKEGRSLLMAVPTSSPNQCLPPKRKGRRPGVGWFSGLLRPQGGCIAQASPAGGQVRGSTG